MLQELDVLIGFVVVMSVVSLLIMVATQAISSCFALRGRNLRDALVAFFLKISPQLGNANQLAEKILQDPVFSDSALSMKRTRPWKWPSWWKLSSAIRAEECLEVIKNIAKTDKFDSTGRDAQMLIDALASSPAQAAIVAIEATLGYASYSPPADVTQTEQYLCDLVGATQSEMESFKTQFNAAQDRAEQWFTMNARWVTVALGFLAAFFLQLDTFELFSRVSRDDELRNGLVNLSKAVQQRADEAMNQDSPGTVYFAVLKQMKNGDEDIKNFDVPQESNAQTYSDATAWLREQADHMQPSLDQKRRGSLIDRFRAAVQTESRKRLESARNEFGEIAGLYGQSNLQLIPSPYPRGVLHFLGILHDGHLGFSHLVGMLATGMLLALGAPFWFNLLKSLTDLRSSVAEKIDKETSKKNAEGLK